MNCLMANDRHPPHTVLDLCGSPPQRGQRLRGRCRAVLGCRQHCHPQRPTFAGNVFAGASITSDGNLTVTCGRLLAATENVTLIQDTISMGCEGTGFESSGGFDQAGRVVNRTVKFPNLPPFYVLAWGLRGYVPSEKGYLRGRLKRHAMGRAHCSRSALENDLGWQ